MNANDLSKHDETCQQHERTEPERTEHEPAHHDDRSDTDEDLASVLISWDEALAAGELPTLLRPTPVAPQQQPRLEKNVACLDLLRRLWPRRHETPSHLTSLPTDAAGTPSNRIGQFL